MKKHIAAACLIGAGLASAPAFAQDSSGSGSSSMNAASSSQGASQGAASGQFLTQMTSDEWRGSKLVGVDVYGSDNSKIGDINEVIVDRNGQAKAIVIGVGGFLGIGEKNVAIPWEKVQWNTGGAQSSGSMAANTSAGGQPAGDRSTPRDVAQTTTGSPNDHNAQPAQSAAAGGATLSAAPSSGTTGNAPANSSSSVVSAPGTSSAASSGSSAGAAVTASGSAHSQDYPDRALVSMSKQDLQNAPDFHYASQASGASGGAKGGAGGSSLTGSTSGR